jgi:hypothetical protein
MAANPRALLNCSPEKDVRDEFVEPLVKCPRDHFAPFLQTQKNSARARLRGRTSQSKKSTMPENDLIVDGLNGK